LVSGYVKTCLHVLICALIIIIHSSLFIFHCSGQSVINTKHNLSVTGPGTIKASTETEVCVFCHTPHNSNPIAPLWNRNSSGATYLLYNSSTQKALPGQPDGSSIFMPFMS